ncbi:MAG TPA: helical backbone metal receptor [Chitinophagaceae bacterium]|nr:helical backbone metal receptor [Chitinophagaceae bacterium]
MKSFIDQVGRTLQIPGTPRKIISLVPSVTELLCDLGLDTQVIGITSYCVHPPQWQNSKTKVGGTKKLDLEKILALGPDLVLANKEENRKEQVESLMQSVPVWVSEVCNVPQALDLVDRIGEITSRQKEAGSLHARIASGFVNPLQPSGGNAVYLIWRKPWMTVGGDTFISDMMRHLGISNAFGSATRYPKVSLEEISGVQPEWVLLSSEPFPFGEKHRAELGSALPGSRIILVDGEMFSWYGSRMVHAATYFRRLREIMGLEGRS